MASVELTDRQIFYIVLYSTISIAAIGGNGIVIYLIANFRRMRTVTNVFILNLAVGDLLMAVFCIPFTFTSNLLLHAWPFGSLMCRVVSYAQAVSVFISAYTLVAISIDRYIAIIYPLRPRMTRRHGLQLIGFIWLVALLTPLPTALLSRIVPIDSVVVELDKLENSTLDRVERLVSTVLNLSISAQSAFLTADSSLRPQYLLHLQPNHTLTATMLTSSDSDTSNVSSVDLPQPNASIGRWTSASPSIAALDTNYQCIEDWSWAGEIDYKSYYSVLLMGLQYGLPFSVLVFTYSRIACVVWGKKAPGEAHDGRDAKMAASKRKMVKMMITCVATFTLCWLPFNILIVLGDRYNVYEYEHIEYVWFACHWLAMSHASYNPIIYIWMNARFRYGFRCVLGKCVPCLLPGHSDDQAQNGRSMANLFSSSARKRLANSQYYNCYSYAMADNVQSMVCAGSASVGSTPNKSMLQVSENKRSPDSEQKSEPRRLSHKRYSFGCAAKPTVTSPLNGKPKPHSLSTQHCEMVKSHSYNGERVTMLKRSDNSHHKNDSLL